MNHSERHEAARTDAFRVVDGQITRADFMRRGIALGLSVPTLSAVIAACGGTAQQNQAQDGNRGPGRTSVTYATSGYPPGFDSESQIALPSIESQWNIYDNLMHWQRSEDEDGNRVEEWNTDSWQNWLLDGFETSSDGRTWTMSVKPDVMSHSGNPLTAQDLKYLWDRHFDLGILGPFWATVARVEGKRSYEVVDDRTFRIRTRTPSPGMLTMLENLLALHPWDSQEARRHATPKDPYSTEWMARNGDKAGHGPYTIEEQRSGDQVMFRAFPDYHAGRPAIERIVYKTIDSSATRLALVKRGDVDIARDLLPTEYEDAAKTDGVEVTSWKGARSRILVLIPNLRERPEFRDVRVRQALAYATPYQRIVEDIYRGFASRWNGAIPQDFPFFSGDAWPYGDGGNVDEAKRLMAQAGLAGGFSTRILYNSSLPELEQVATVLRAAFAEIGIDVQLDKLADAAFTQRYTGKRFELLLLDDLTLTPDIGYSTYLWFQKTSPQNVGYYANAEVDRLSERILSTLDDDQRAEDGARLQQLLVQDCPQVFVCQPHFTIAKRQAVQGETATSARVLRFDDLSLAT